MRSVFIRISLSVYILRRTTSSSNHYVISFDRTQLGMSALALLSLLALYTECVFAQVEIRLRGGKHAYEGRIELKYQGVWKGVCDHGWDKKGGIVACKMLGYPDLTRYTTGMHFGVGSYEKWLSNVKCGGYETTLVRCSRSDWGKYKCKSSESAGVVCRPYASDLVLKPAPSTTNKGVKAINVRLVGDVRDRHISQGIVQVELNGRWGHVCSEGWSYEDARVVCGQLGFPDANRNDPAANGGSNTGGRTRRDVQYFITELNCRGTESALVSCEHQGLQSEGYHCNGGPVAVTCARKSTLDIVSELRLVSGGKVWHGRVEVKHHDHWGTVCDDNFTLLNGNVFCRSLGYGTVKEVLSAAHYGQGMGKVWKDSVRCTGTETSFHDCPFSGLANLRKTSKAKSRCTHYEDVSVKCNAPELHGNKIRLVSHAHPKEGRVEVFRNGQWGTVCGDRWGIIEASVVCRQLNLGLAKAKFQDSYFGTNPNGHKMSGVHCKHNDVTLHDCLHDGWENVTCSSAETIAGVMCIKELPDISINIEMLQRTVRLESHPLASLKCAYEEGCLSSTANVFTKRTFSGYRNYYRRLLRFSSQVENRGLANFLPQAPKNAWQWHSCHQHFHSMEVFANYDLLDEQHNKIAEGHKASFCLEDTQCDAGITKKWNCTGGAPQGISPNCYDVYYWHTDCQWIDVSDFPHGYFILRVHVNPDRKVAESNYQNNVARCSIYDYGHSVEAQRCYLETCESGIHSYAGNSNGACCVFPFLYMGKWYHECTKAGSTRFWCATTRHLHLDRKWGLC